MDEFSSDIAVLLHSPLHKVRQLPPISSWKRVCGCVWSMRVVQISGEHNDFHAYVPVSDSRQQAINKKMMPLSGQGNSKYKSWCCPFQVTAKMNNKSWCPFQATAPIHYLPIFSKRWGVMFRKGLIVNQKKLGAQGGWALDDIQRGTETDVSAERLPPLVPRREDTGMCGVNREIQSRTFYLFLLVQLRCMWNLSYSTASWHVKYVSWRSDFWRC